MAKKQAKTKTKKEDAMQTTTPKRRAGRPQTGPWWRPSRERWMAKIDYKQYYAPAEIGRMDLDGARKWYAELRKRLGVGAAPAPAPESEKIKKTFTFTSQAIADLNELTPLVASEHMLAGRNESHTVCVAIHEALERRRVKGKD